MKVGEHVKACLSKSQVNRPYAEMSAHYDIGSCRHDRPWRPRDKAKVEIAVLIIERWRFHSLAELNTAIAERCTSVQGQTHDSRADPLDTAASLGLSRGESII
jgi:transposase